MTNLLPGKGGNIPFIFKHKSFSGWVLKMRRSMLSTVEPEIKADEGEPPAKRAKVIF